MITEACVTKDSLGICNLQSPNRLESIYFMTTGKRIAAQQYHSKAVLGHIYFITILSLFFLAFVRR